eukprot:TRINITY_DN7315_c0_g1_i1.p1 TRINITY_DN7315_c0_g1~~TRINITY_DN7315_c0_g1_i1.p1  ORF type:complete len:160 (-),score=5.84 TRINITY_DN7315_c0_g1_i1:26-505(-)
MWNKNTQIKKRKKERIKGKESTGARHHFAGETSRHTTKGKTCGLVPLAITWYTPSVLHYAVNGIQKWAVLITLTRYRGRRHTPETYGPAAPSNLKREEFALNKVHPTFLCNIRNSIRATIGKRRYIFLFFFFFSCLFSAVILLCKKKKRRRKTKFPLRS